MPEATLAWAYDEALRCVKCGFCLQTCPTYLQLGIETASPRGRLALVRAVAEGRLDPGAPFADPLYQCLGCRACESACPSGLQYGQILEGARAAVEPYLAARRPWWVRGVRRFGLQWLLPHPRRLRLVAAVAGILQRTGWLHVAARLLPSQARRAAAGLPPAPTGGQRRAWSRLFRPLPGGAGGVARAATARYRVAFLPGCVMDALYLPANLATVRLLVRSGCDVVVPAGATCCGALHAHSGNRPAVAALARRNVAALRSIEAVAGCCDAIIANAGGCGAHLKGYAHLLDGDGSAAGFAARCRDLTEWLAEIGLPRPVRELPAWITYQDSCHLRHGQGIREQPRRLLKEIPGVSLVEMDGADRCCGSAGIYNLLHPQMAAALQGDRVKAIAGTRAALVVTANPGCQLQLQAGLAAADMASGIRVCHIAELLDWATAPDAGGPGEGSIFFP